MKTFITVADPRESTFFVDIVFSLLDDCDISFGSATELVVLLFLLELKCSLETSFTFTVKQAFMAFKIFLRQFIEYLYLSRDENRIAVVISDITFHIMCQLCSVEETIKQLQRSEEAFASVIFFKTFNL